MWNSWVRGTEFNNHRTCVWPTDRPRTVKWS